MHDARYTEDGVTLGAENGARGTMFPYIAEGLRSLAVPVTSLVPDAANARKHNEKNIEAIKASLSRFGQRAPIVVQRKGMVVRAGNGRLEAAKAIGWTHIAAVIVDEESADAVAFAIADNRTAELAEWDKETLASLLDTLPEDDLGVTGFDESDLKELLSELTPEVVDDTPPEPPPTPVSKTGDLWLLGDHRLLCGDSTKAEDVARLMGGAKALVCLTDPPYGLGENKDSGKNNYDQYVDSRANLEKLARGWLPIAKEMCESVVFSPGVTNAWIYPEADWIMCWFYGGGQLRSSWGFNCWQPFLCYGKDPSLATGNGGRPDGVNMNTPANAGDINHPCPKPVALWVWFMERLSFAKGDLFYEPFGGSGTTLIAAEQLGRKCYGMEISPQYCDVIVTRWEKLTGKKATCGGKTIEELAEERGVSV